MGIRNLKEFKEAALVKLAWEFLKNEKESCKFLKARFYSKQFGRALWKDCPLLNQIHTGV